MSAGRAPPGPLPMPACYRSATPLPGGWSRPGQRSQAVGHMSGREEPGVRNSTAYDGYRPQDPLSRWKYLALAQRQVRMPTMTPTIVTRAGRYPLATWTTG